MIVFNSTYTYVQGYKLASYKNFKAYWSFNINYQPFDSDSTKAN